VNPQIAKIYGNKLRLRVCGLDWDHERLLLINHRIQGETDFWAPPGGGVEFGESLEEALIREFHEETGMTVSVGRFLFGCQFIRRPLHAVELFFEVTRVGGAMLKGYDPEIQVIHEARYVSPSEIQALRPEEKHGIFRLGSEAKTMLSLSGFYHI
jgi:8-oxo-dGTP diphosphatase